MYGKEGSIDSGGAEQQVIFVLGVISLATMLLFVGIVLIFWQKALWHVIQAKWQGT